MNAHNGPSAKDIAAIKANCARNDEQRAIIGHGRGESHKRTAAAIFKAAAATSFVLGKAVQIHGGAGTQEVRKLIISGELLKN